ncbi:hypothetical protein LO771_24540 [Streptacidiphilus sp. ASG 303]|uniref:hypothetical protein n=1 Tax=Streptacidiphilus sp. ASG 303 TaxID=2896847 RepID=UPI001E2ACAE4|nr:hypothetical protein [Streptacidiphilus sp. ASG 303]MCD0485466.1 hypothetical protein [Streptacidiphilus sp. ASG 303]
MHREQGMEQGRGPAEEFLGDAAVPPQQGPTVRQVVGRAAFGVAAAAGLVAAVVLGTPALQTPEAAHHGGGSGVHRAADAPR